MNPTRIEAKAAEDLRYIRETMERASEFTAVPGRGGVAMGLVAIGAGGLSTIRPDEAWWVLCWLAAAPVGILVGGSAMLRKARRLGVSLTGAAGRRFTYGLAPPLLAGAVLTVGLCSGGYLELLPGTWLLLYGTGVLTGGMNSVPLVPRVGVCFMAFGVVAMVTPLPVAQGLLVAGFGGLHVIFGWVIMRRYGG